MRNLEEFTPIALIENAFTFEKKQQTHYGIVFMARIPKRNNLIKDVVSKSINEKVYFANPHNEVLFELAKKYVEKYKIKQTLQREIIYSRKSISKEAKKKRKQIS